MCFWCGSAANIIHIFNIPKHLVKENIKEGYIFMKNGCRLCITQTARYSQKIETGCLLHWTAFSCVH